MNTPTFLPPKCYQSDLYSNQNICTQSKNRLVLGLWFVGKAAGIYAGDREYDEDDNYCSCVGLSGLTFSQLVMKGGWMWMWIGGSCKILGIWIGVVWLYGTKDTDTFSYFVNGIVRTVDIFRYIFNLFLGRL